MCAYEKWRSIYYTSNRGSLYESLGEAKTFVSFLTYLLISLESKNLD